MINRRTFLRQAAAIAAAVALEKQLAAAKQVTAQDAQASRPNLLFIMPDEFRIQALGIWNQPGYRNLLHTVSDPVHTPELNRLARESILFTQTTSTSPICSPSRAMMMSGMYPSRNGVMGTNCAAGRPEGMHDSITCFTDVLSDAGYETAYVGKTHWERNQPLFDAQGNYVGTENPAGGHYANQFDTYIPPGRGRHGNKYWFQTIKDRHFDPWTYASVPALVGGKKDGQVYRPKGFTPKLEADILVDYLRNKNRQRDPGKPFSMIWAPNPPHPPYNSLKDCQESVYREYYADVPISKLLNRPNVEIAKAVSDGYFDPQKCGPVYFSLVTSIDQQVGRVLGALDESGEAENTIVVFTSDHGEMMGSHGLTGKSVIYDEAFLIPFMIRYPKRLKPRAESLLLGRVDVMPTLLGMMGLKDQIPATAQGVDYSKEILTGESSESSKPRSAPFLMSTSKGVRTDRYTYQVDSKGMTLLFDNAADPCQMKNLGHQSIDPADFSFLQKELGRWLKVAGDPWYETRMHKEWIAYPA